MTENLSLIAAVLDSVHEALVISDEDGNITGFGRTAEALFGYAQADVLGRNVSMLMGGPDRHAHDGYIDRYRHTGEKRIIGIGREVHAVKADGTVFPIALSVGEATVDGRRYFTGFIRDLTASHTSRDRIQMLQDSLAHASRISAAGTMAEALAHELNQPLAAIANYLSAARDMADAVPEDLREDLRYACDEAARQALRAGQIIRRLRDFIARDELSMEVVPLAEIIGDALALGAMNAREKGVTVRKPAGYSGDVFADRVQLQQVFVNLFRNAIEAMAGAEAKELSISVTERDDKVEIAVADTGCGIPPDVQARLFQPFTTVKACGMGLGLSISKTIVEAHGGRLWAEPNTLRGAIFKFTLDRPVIEVTHGGQ